MAWSPRQLTASWCCAAAEGAGVLGAACCAFAVAKMMPDIRKMRGFVTEGCMGQLDAALNKMEVNGSPEEKSGGGGKHNESSNLAQSSSFMRREKALPERYCPGVTLTFRPVVFPKSAQ